MNSTSGVSIFANPETLSTLYGSSITDFGRLAGIDSPALVLWGEADRIVDAEHGRALAAAIPGARFELLSRTGHAPQMIPRHVLSSRE